MPRIFQTLLLATVVAGLGGGAALANSIPPNQFPGNDCNGSGGGVVAGQGFNNCTLNGSPVIIRFNTPGSTSINPLFPSVTGTEFSFTPGTSGTWTYTPNDATDPAITGFVAKGGPFFRVFTTVNFDPDTGPYGTFSGFWETPIGAGPNDDQPFGLSHLTFFDTANTGGGGNGGGDPSDVPAPAALGLFGLALLGFGLSRRRR